MEVKDYYEINKNRVKLISYLNEKVIVVGYNSIRDIIYCFLLDNKKKTSSEFQIMNDSKLSLLEDECNVFGLDITEEYKNSSLLPFRIEEISNIIFFKDKYITSINEFFFEFSSKRRNCIEVDLSFEINNNEKVTLILDKPLSKDKDVLFHIYLSYKNLEFHDVFFEDDLYSILEELLSCQNQEEINRIYSVLKEKDNFAIKKFISDNENFNLVKEAIAWYFIIMNENKRTESEDYKKLKYLFINYLGIIPKANKDFNIDFEKNNF